MDWSSGDYIITASDHLHLEVVPLIPSVPFFQTVFDFFFLKKLTYTVEMEQWMYQMG
jgi:hypothetical protein